MSGDGRRDGHGRTAMLPLVRRRPVDTRSPDLPVRGHPDATAVRTDAAGVGRDPGSGHGTASVFLPYPD